jgi:hypothetical protein
MRVATVNASSVVKRVLSDGEETGGRTRSLMVGPEKLVVGGDI